MTITALVLAAGRSTRMGSNKLLEFLGDRPLLHHTVEAALRSKANPVFVVTGHQDEAIRSTLSACDVCFVANPDYAKGLSTSLKAGIAALPSSCQGVIVLLGDMPLIESSLIDRIIKTFQSSPDASAVVPTYQGEWGNPVLIARRLFDDVQSLEGDAGARKLLMSHRDEVIESPVETSSILMDLDTPEALAKARGSARSNAQ